MLQNKKVTIRTMMQRRLLMWMSRLSGSYSIKTLVFPSQTSTSYVELVPQKAMKLNAYTMCMRLATELSGNRKVILFAYRTGPCDELNLWRELDGR